MKTLGKLIALMLLVAVVSPVALGYGPSQARQQRLAGCHEHGRKSSVPGPVTYECCRVGHQFAAVREAVETRTPLVQSPGIIEVVVSPVLRPAGQVQLRAPAASPPMVTSLRI